MITNEWLDSLFQANDSFINSLTNNEVINGNIEIPQFDATDYMFNVSTERYGGGVFLDGLDSAGQNQQVTLVSQNTFQDSVNVYLHPTLSPLNRFPPVVLLQEACFWYCTLDPTSGRPNVEFVRGSRVRQLLNIL